MRQKTAGDRIKALRGEMSQADFGQLLNSSQGAVSAWERDDKDRSPSAAVYFRLAALARDPEDSVFFLEQTGLEPSAVVSVAKMLFEKGVVEMDDTILSTAEAKLKEGRAEQLQRAKEGKDFLVPPYEGVQPLPFEVTVPAVQVLNEASTYYVVARSSGPSGGGVTPGDIIIFDTCGASRKGYEPFIGEKVLVEFQDGLFVGRLVSTQISLVPALAIAPVNLTPGASHLHDPNFRLIALLGSHPSGQVRIQPRIYPLRSLFGIWIGQYSGGVPVREKKLARLALPKDWSSS